MGGKSQPDFGQVASDQGEENRRSVTDQLYANRPTIYTPFGYQGWSTEEVVDPSTGKPTTRWEMTQGLTPELQDILNKQTAIQGGRTDVAGMLTGRMGQEFNQAMDWRGLSPMGHIPNAQYTLPERDAGNPYETRQRAEDAMWQQAQSRLQPQQESQRQQMEIKLRNQGLGPGDAQYQAAMQQMGRQHTDQNNQALWSSVGEGRQESGQMYGQQMGRQAQNFGQALSANQQNFGQGMQQSAYANQIRQQQLTEAMQRRGFSLNEINALMSGQQVGLPQMPNFNTAQAAQPAPIMQGAAQQASMQNASNPWSAISGLAGQALGGYIGAGGFGG